MINSIICKKIITFIVEPKIFYHEKFKWSDGGI
jgi:hypothetical protein